MEYTQIMIRKSILLFILITVITGQTSFARGPSEDMMRNIDVPDFEIDNFECAENCETVSFFERPYYGADYEALYESGLCPECKELKFTFQNVYDKGTFLEYFYIVDGNNVVNFKSYLDYAECTFGVEYLNKRFEILTKYDLNNGIKTCLTSVDTVDCEGDCSNLKVYAYEDNANYNSRLVFSTCENSNECRWFEVDNHYSGDDYGVLPNTYYIDFKSIPYDVNNTLGAPKEYLSGGESTHIASSNLESRTLVKEDVEGSIIEFELVTDEINLIKGGWGFLYGYRKYLIGIVFAGILIFFLKRR
jgi:hypothetical protein